MHPRDPAILGKMGLKDICIRYIMVNLKFSTAHKQVQHRKDTVYNPTLT